MAGRIHPTRTGAGSVPTREYLSILLRMVPWRMHLVPILLIILALPTFVYGISIGRNIFFGVTHFFYDLSAPSVASPTPQPPLLKLLPQVGSVLYTVERWGFL